MGYNNQNEIMRNIVLTLMTLLFLVNCSNVPRKSVEEPLSNKELSAWLKEDTFFVNEYYKEFRDWWETLDQIEQVKYAEVTYQRLDNYIKYDNDSIIWTPFQQQCKEEWIVKYGKSLSKADSIIAYWDSVSQEHLSMMSKFAKIELKKINTEYYAYIGGIKNVDLGFLITPLQGTIQQIRFEYAYGAKINETTSNKRNCICTSPITSPSIKWWEVPYSERERFGGETAASFLRDYDMIINITSIRKDNINYNIDDIDVPKAVKSYLDAQKDEWSARYMLDYYKKEVITSIIQSDYVDEWKYYYQKKDIELEKHDNICFDLYSSFLKYYFDKKFK